MKNKILFGLAFMLSLCACIFALTACGENEPTHKHNFVILKIDEKNHWLECECKEKDNVAPHIFKNGECACGYIHFHEYSTLKNDETQHWYECVCGDKSSIENHKGGTESCTEIAVCSVCDIEYDSLKQHNYNTLKKSETQHWYECVCGDKSGIKAHKGGNATCTRLAVCSVCKAEYGTLKQHNYATMKHNATQHWYECVCGDKSGIEAHKGGNATCTRLAVCSVCNIEYGGYAPHPYESKWTYDKSHHWHESSCDCEVKVAFEQHTPEDSGWCTVCKQAVLPTNGISYEVSADGTYAEVIGYLGTSTKVNIASTYNGLPVTSIGDDAFEDCHNLTSITIPDSVTSIGDNAFKYCISLTSIIIPDSVTSIGDDAFVECWELTSVVIGDSVTSIDDYAFEDCSNLTSVVIGDGVTSIGDYAFENCSGLTSITIPDSVTSIGDYAFYDCEKLTSVTIGNSVTSIGDHAFYCCSSLTSITIPDSVTSIGRYAFSICSSLTSITFADTSTWYRNDWINGIVDEQTNVTDSTTNATYFRNKYSSYSWYKK